MTQWKRWRCPDLRLMEVQLSVPISGDSHDPDAPARPAAHIPLIETMHREPWTSFDSASGSPFENEFRIVTVL
jgi:hypothetical protein